MTQDDFGYATTGDKIRALEARYQGNPDLFPWQNSNQRNDFDPGFVEYIRKFLNAMRLQGNPARKGDALAYINLRQRRGSELLATLEGRWADYLDDQKNQAAQAAAQQAAAVPVLAAGAGLPAEFDPEAAAAQRARARRIAQGLPPD